MSFRWILAAVVPASIGVLAAACSSNNAAELCDLGAGEITSASCDKIASDHSCETHQFTAQIAEICSAPQKTGTRGCCAAVNCGSAVSIPEFASGCTADAGAD